MRPAPSELGIRPTVIDKLKGRSLQVPNGEGGWQSMRVNTLKSSILAGLSLTWLDGKRE